MRRAAGEPKPSPPRLTGEFSLYGDPRLGAWCRVHLFAAAAAAPVARAALCRDDLLLLLIALL